MKKILVILTNTAKYGTKNEATGLWLSEATEFVKELIQAGYVLDYVSPRGGYVPIDPRSLKNAMLMRKYLLFMAQRISKTEHWQIPLNHRI